MLLLHNYFIQYLLTNLLYKKLSKLFSYIWGLPEITKNLYKKNSCELEYQYHFIARLQTKIVLIFFLIVFYYFFGLNN